MTHAASLRLQLVAALALTACSTGPKPAPNAQPVTDPQPVTEPEQPAESGVAIAALQPIADDALGCTGEGGPMVGPCCVEAQCFTPKGDTCPDQPSDAQRRDWGWAGLGSGRCECAPLQGPFSNVGTDHDGACCYTLGVQGCTGRPLPVGGQLRTAALTPRSDWAELARA